MDSRVQKWGNSLALRIPKALAAQLQLEVDSPVHIHLADGQLIITRASKPSLEELLAGVTPQNVHGEVQTGRAVGREHW